jgi:predicted 2-oxoglutarate/Fe(II)-dependent dioxygenase YbiX
MITKKLDLGLIMVEDVFNNGNQIIEFLENYNSKSEQENNGTIWNPWVDGQNSVFCYQKRLQNKEELFTNHKYYEEELFLINEINLIADKALEEYFSEYTFARANLKGRERPNILKYVKGGFLPPHQDHGVSTRALSVLIYLNDDYEGGEISFPISNITIKPKAGSVVLFPSNFLYVHTISDIVSGTRYSIPAWFHNRHDMLMSDGTE